MSQLQVTGEAKIRDIQGPVVANSGVITALDGAANQYVRGDGTLASFPTSSGGGSSVSYYLNGSVNQGTFGGSTYYQMSKNAIVGTGTNFSTSANGLIAQFITDANDPDVVSIPSGNWNIEFFMSVSASSGALASFYVEIYKYNGSTFTLLATNVATPEQLTNTTTVDAYFTSVAMPLSAMAVTDRLAVRVFANVASKTVTLYTEDNRLCQIVTTFSKGMLSLNNLTDQSQYLATGTSGTDFNIVSSGDTHTFNIPSASASNRGLITTGSQTIAGAKTFSSNIISDGSILLKNGIQSVLSGYVNIGGNAFGKGIDITFPDSGGSPLINTLNFNPTTAYSYTFPAASGTLALTSNLSSYVPYTGATANVALGAFSMSLTTLNVNNIGANNNGTDDIGAAGAGNKFRNVYANSFVTTSGTSSQFVKGNGTLDSTSYLPLGGGTLTGNLTGTFIFAKDQFTTTKNSVAGTSAFYGFQTLSGVNRWNFAITGLETGSNVGFNFNIDRYDDSGNILSTALSINRATGNATFSNNLTANSLIKSGGTSSQFLKADGSVDSTSYVPYTGATADLQMGSNNISLRNLLVNEIFPNGDNVYDIGSSAGNKFRNIYANSFVKTGGTSSQFLKANGSIDSNTYLTTSSALSTYVPYTGANANLDMGTGVYGINTGQFLLLTKNGSDTLGISAYQGFLNLSGSDGVYLQLNASNDLSLFGRTSGINSGKIITFTRAGAGIFTGSLSGTSATFSGDLIIDTNTLYVDSANNRVGIGIIPTDGTLHVNAGSGRNFVVASNGTNNLAIRNFSTASGHQTLTISASTFTIFTGTAGDSAVTQRFTITPTGPIGIGTNNPNVSSQGVNNTLMTIQGQGGSYGMLEIGATTNIAESLIGVLGFTSTNVTGGLIGFISMAAEGTTGTNVGGRIQFNTKANGGSIIERMRITSSGVVRINNFTSNGLVGTDASGNLGVVNSTYTEIATGTISYSMIAGNAWGINNSFPANIRNYADDLIAGTTGSNPGANEFRGVTFDLGSSKAVRRIVERGYGTACINTITVQFSSDNSNWSTIFIYPHIYNNTQKLMDFNPTGAISARYWRWYISSWTEREITNYYTYESIIYT